MKKFSSLILITTSLVLQGCTVGHYNLNNQLRNPSPRYEDDEKVVYHLSFITKPEQLTRDAHYSESAIDKIKQRHSKSTQKIFDKEGIIAIETETQDAANFLIHIDSTPFHSALPQEFLTGLSFGLIPSWGTRYDEYSYTFKKAGRDSEHTYTVDMKTYNHLICFPVFWTMFFTLDESKVYEKALINYLREK